MSYNPSGAGGGGGGAPTLVSASATVSPAVWGTATFSLVDVDASSGQSVLIQLAPSTDYDADTLADFSVMATCGTGTVDVTLQTNGPIGGTFAFTYVLGAV